MAGPLDTGQLSLAFASFLPTIFSWLLSELTLAIAALLSYRQLWQGIRMRVFCHPIKHRKKKIIARPPQRHHSPRTYLLMVAAVHLFKVGCCVESLVSTFLRQRLPPRTSAKSSLLHRIACHASFGSPSNTVRFDTDSFQIGIDNHCSVSMVKSTDLLEDLVLDNHKRRVNGIEGGLEILGRGTFVFNIEDDDGKIHTVRIPNSVYVPGLRYCLLSPQHWAQMANDHHPTPRGTRMENDDQHCILIWGQGHHRRSVPHSSSTNTPTFRTAPATSTYSAFVALHEAMEAQLHSEHVLQIPGRRPTGDEDFVAEENLLLDDEETFEGASHDDVTAPTSNQTREVEEQEDTAPTVTRLGPLTFDLTPALETSDRVDVVAADDQAELMRWHHRLGHLSFAKLKILAANGEIPKKFAKVKPPTCAGCLYGAMTKVPWRGRDSAGEVFVASRPGQCVSVDQMISTQVGFVAQLKGTLTKKRYKAATIFVDHFSRLQYVHLMTSLSSEETIAAKLAFERFSNQNGVRIEHYHCDNGRFADNDFKSACEQARQRLTFCGVNAHFQNGIAEKAIRDLSESARKQLLHARQRWPAAVHLALWPYAMRNAAHLHNVLPVRDDNTSRLELFSSIRVGLKLRHAHVFGCPVFALQNELSSGSSLPKWSPRARLGINLGPSPHHARNVSLVLNPHTGCVSPQYHCRFDDFFETVRHSGPDVAIPTTWLQLAGLVRVTNTLSMEEHDDAPLPSQRMTLSHDQAPQQASSTDVPTSISTGLSQENLEDSFSLFDPSDLGLEPHRTAPAPPLLHQPANPPPPAEPLPPTAAGTSSRGRLRTMSRAMADSVSQRGFFGRGNMHYMASKSVCEHDYAASHDRHIDLQERMRRPIAFLSEMMGDVMYLHQALRQPDSRDFVNAVIKEINGHVDRNHWALVTRADVPKDVEVLPSVWSMRRKRDLTTGAISKHKARLNLHGGKQEFGINYYETYAPVVTWFAIRLLIVFGLLFGWALRQVDFVMAYPQAPIEIDMYMEIPQGIVVKGASSKQHVLKLLANIYGQKQAGRVWNAFLVDKLREIGFIQSLVDDCVFYRDDLIFIVYVDDGIFLGPNDDAISNAITELLNLDLDIEDQGHPADYVGVAIKRLRDGSLELSQRALIDTIIADANIDDTKVKRVPAKVKEHLHAHLDKPPYALHLNYRSAIGKLNYVGQTSRPEIMYAVHQLAKYSSNPREPHGEALLYLIRYLKLTRDVGLRFSPKPDHGFACYADADFAGNWNRALAPHDPSTAKSRSGWIVFYAGCPVIWASKLQSMVALATTEAEYIALSQALRDVLPIMFLIQEIREKGFTVIADIPQVYCKAFEDNSGALELARLPKLRPRTKHINTCFHHFREHVRNGLIKIYPIGTKDQIADVLTKALPQNDLQRHRKAISGV
jgi:hypothetical protein